jgi:hypothetical protein
MLPTSTVPTGSASSGESRTFADQQSGTVVGGVGLAQMALLVNGASSQTVWIGSRSRRSRPESPHTRKDGNGNPRGRLPPPGVPPFFLRADAIGAASDRSRTQSEGRSPSVREVQFVAAFPAATTDPTARPASPRVAKRARSSHPGSRLLHDRLAFGSGRAPSEPPQGRSWSRHRTQAGLRWCRYLPQGVVAEPWTPCSHILPLWVWGWVASGGKRGHDEEGTGSDGRCGTAGDLGIVSTRGRRRMGRSCQGRRPCRGHLGDLARHEHNPRSPSVAAQRSCWRVRRGDRRRCARERRTRQDRVCGAPRWSRRGASGRAWTLRGLHDLCDNELEDGHRSAGRTHLTSDGQPSSTE